ncbi:hypothetical protein PGTUg99_003809 [Puccinia graminis f. sp. tritici]|uniref:Uncharacterized protein n=1 Tax=Puccinia graminis f. sp. tritici TaxID=56615 RepID=A0A5B0SIA5_PUCGR|nr:hypothetical protein PGTUg99_003809 [Puccinia graminis f. sp. tritici]
MAGESTRVSITHRIVPSRALIGQTSDASSLSPRETQTRVLAPRLPAQKPLATGPRHDTAEHARTLSRQTELSGYYRSVELLVTDPPPFIDWPDDQLDPEFTPASYFIDSAIIHLESFLHA